MPDTRPVTHIIQFDEALDDKELRDISDTWEHHFPGVKAVVMDREAKIITVTSDGHVAVAVSPNILSGPALVSYLDNLRGITDE